MGDGADMCLDMIDDQDELECRLALSGTSLEEYFGESGLAHGGAFWIRPEKTPAPSKCSSCASDMVIRDGKYGPFIGCAKFPDCKDGGTYSYARRTSEHRRVDA